MCALLKKADTYGRTRLGRPYIVGIDLLGWPDDQDVLNVLYRKNELGWPDGERVGGGSPVWRRPPDGLWRGERGWIRSHIAAVLTVDDLAPWKVAASVPTLWHQPAADHPLANPFAVVRQGRFDGATNEVRQASAQVGPAEFFGLKSGWPFWKN